MGKGYYTTIAAKARTADPPEPRRLATRLSRRLLRIFAKFFTFDGILSFIQPNLNQTPSLVSKPARGSQRALVEVVLAPAPDQVEQRQTSASALAPRRVTFAVTLLGLGILLLSTYVGNSKSLITVGSNANVTVDLSLGSGAAPVCEVPSADSDSLIVYNPKFSEMSPIGLSFIATLG